MPRQSYGDASGQGGPSFHRRSQAVPLPPSPQRTPTLRAAATASPARERRVHLPAGLTPERLRQSSSSGPRLFPEKVAGILPQLPQSHHRFPRRRTGGWLGPARRLLRKPPASPGERAAPAGIKIKTTQPQIHGHSKCEAKAGKGTPGCQAETTRKLLQAPPSLLTGRTVTAGEVAARAAPPPLCVEKKGVGEHRWLIGEGPSQLIRLGASLGIARR